MITKHHLKKFIERDKPKTALDYLLLTTQKYSEYEYLENRVIVKMALWSRLNNEEIISGEKNHSQWNKLNMDVLEIINLLDDREYNVLLLDSKDEIDSNLKYGTRGRWIKKIAIFFGILSTLFIISFTWVGIDRKQIAFKYFFSDIETIDHHVSLRTNEFIGNWELERPYVIRREYLYKDSTKIYYVIGKKAEAHLFSIDNNRLAGYEYIINTIYEVNSQDTSKLDNVIIENDSFKKLVKDESFNKLTRKISDISVVFHEELDFGTKKETNEGSRTGHYVGPFVPENAIKHYFLSKEKKDIVEKILDRYNKTTIRSCEMKYDESYKVLKFICGSIGDISINYTKRIKKIRED